MLWGPIWFIRDSALANSVQGAILLLALSIAFIVGGLSLPKRWAFLIVALAAAAWLLTGIVGQGIGC